MLRKLTYTVMAVCVIIVLMLLFNIGLQVVPMSIGATALAAFIVAVIGVIAAMASPVSVEKGKLTPGAAGGW